MTEVADQRAAVPQGLRNRLARATTPDAQVQVLRGHLLRRARAKSPAWVDEVADLAEELALDAHVVRSTISNLGWEAREVGQALPAIKTGSGLPSMRQSCRRYLLGFRLRFDYKFEALAENVVVWLRDDPDDALLLALSGFAGAGLQSSRALRDVEASLRSPTADAQTRRVCLQALWFGDHIDRQAERIIELSDDMITRGEGNANTHYWRAYAFRRLQRFDEAMSSIDRAIDLHPPGMNLVHQDYVRERELIGTSQLVLGQVTARAEEVSAELHAELRTQLDAAKAELRKQQEDAQKVVADSLLKIVEILGLFIALAGFLVGSGIIAFRAAGFWQNFASMVLILVGSILFFGLLRFVIRYRPGRRSRKRQQ